MLWVWLEKNHFLYLNKILPNIEHLGHECVILKILHLTHQHPHFAFSSTILTILKVIPTSNHFTNLFKLIIISLCHPGKQWNCNSVPWVSHVARITGLCSQAQHGVTFELYGFLPKINSKCIVSSNFTPPAQRKWHFKRVRLYNN